MSKDCPDKKPDKGVLIIKKAPVETEAGRLNLNVMKIFISYSKLDPLPLRALIPVRLVP
jgi:hypothetical protein